MREWKIWILCALGFALPIAWGIAVPTNPYNTGHSCDGSYGEIRVYLLGGR